MTTRQAPSYYLNTDLCLTSDADLTPLINQLEHSTDVLYCQAGTDSKWYAGIEASGSGIRFERDPADDIDELLQALTKIDEEGRKLLRSCSKIEFDIGWQSAERRPEARFAIPPAQIKAIAEWHASIAVTIYPSCENDLAENADC